MKVVDRVGQQFGNWTVLQHISRGSRGKSRCRCTCGTVRDIFTTTLASGQSKGCRSCGRKKVILKAKRDDTGLQVLLKHYKYKAVKRGLEFALSCAEFQELTQSNCHYCDKAPSQVFRADSRSDHPWNRYVYNGIDRRDNTRGYVPGNCLPCCGDCNKAKGTRGYSEYTAWLVASVEHLRRVGCVS